MRPATVPAALLGASAAALAWASAEAQAFTVRRYTLPVLPAGHAPLTVLHISDLHLLARQHRKQGWVARLAELEPDLVVSTGDNLAAPDAVPAVLAAYGELLRRPGVFVLGSNDYWGPRPKNPARYFLQGGGRRITGVRLPTEELVAGLTAAGWLDLDNRRATLRVAGRRLDAVGVDDPHLEFDRYPDPVVDPLSHGPHHPLGLDEGAATAPPATATAPAALTLGVTHAPYRRVLDTMAADGADLILAGHTHGGQLRVPGVGALVTNCDLPRRQARGVSAWPPGAAPSRHLGAVVVHRPAVLHVCAGLGTSPYTPVRFACRPEAALLTLTAADG